MICCDVTPLTSRGFGQCKKIFFPFVSRMKVYTASKGCGKSHFFHKLRKELVPKFHRSGLLQRVGADWRSSDASREAPLTLPLTLLGGAGCRNHLRDLLCATGQRALLLVDDADQLYGRDTGFTTLEALKQLHSLEGVDGLEMHLVGSRLLPFLLTGTLLKHRSWTFYNAQYPFEFIPPFNGPLILADIQPRGVDYLDVSLANQAFATTGFRSFDVAGPRFEQHIRQELEESLGGKKSYEHPRPLIPVLRRTLRLLREANQDLVRLWPLHFSELGEKSWHRRCKTINLSSSTFDDLVDLHFLLDHNLLAGTVSRLKPGRLRLLWADAMLADRGFVCDDDYWFELHEAERIISAMLLRYWFKSN